MAYENIKTVKMGLGYHDNGEKLYIHNKIDFPNEIDLPNGKFTYSVFTTLPDGREVNEQITLTEGELTCRISPNEAMLHILERFCSHLSFLLYHCNGINDEERYYEYLKIRLFRDYMRHEDYNSFLDKCLYC